VDYKDIGTLQKLCTTQGKLFSRKRSGNCAKHQRKVKLAVKRARFIGLMPFVG
jgi:small subunit ribosomal protein S18